MNGDVGARTQLASLIAAGLVLLATFFLLPVLYFLPKCVLASMFVSPAPHHIVRFDPGLHSICLFAMSFFSEVPHDLVYNYKYVVFLQTSAPNLRM